MRRGRARNTLVSSCVLALVGACNPDFDTTRQVPPRGTVGRELYSLVCDRVGAQSLREDVTGSSFHAICHPDANGDYATTVDTTRLVALDEKAVDESGAIVPMEKQEKDRAYEIGRVEALGRRREDLVAAFDAVLPDQEILVKALDSADPAATCTPSKAKDRLLSQLAETLSRFIDLYNDQTFPMVTRALGRLMRDVQGDTDVQAALARCDARKGYRPSSIALGVAQPAVVYPRLVELVHALTHVLGSDSAPYDPKTIADPKRPFGNDNRTPVPGVAAPDFQMLLRVLHEELRTATSDPPLAPLTFATDPLAAGRPILSRPRSTLEISRLLLLDDADSYVQSATPRFIAQRDPRGYVAVPASGGSVPTPFVDLTGPAGKPDGLPDLDALGQFVTKTPVATPFFAVDATDGRRDAMGRAIDVKNAPLYGYVDTNRTFAAALVHDLRPFFDADPTHGHETMMSLLAGVPLVFGARDETAKTTRTYPPDASAIGAWKLLHPGETPPDSLAKAPVVLPYRAFHPETSPIVDLVYALGQNLSDPAMDDALALFRKLLAEHPNEMARMIGLGLQLKAIADKHPEARIPENSTLWDEVLDTVAKMTEPGVKNPGLLDDLIRAFAKDETLKLAPIFTAYVANRDELTYDHKNLNGPAFNLTSGGVDPLKTPVDRALADSGTNRSALQRFMQLLHDANGLAACTKDGAVAHVDIKWLGVPVKLDYPTDALAKTVCVFLGETAPSKLPACGVLRIDNVAALLLDVALGRAKFDIRDACLKKLSESPLTDLVGGVDAFLEQTSGINGFSTHPTVSGVARMVYYDTAHDGFPGDVTVGTAKTHKFLLDVLDPVPSMVCPETPFTDSDGKIVRLRKCASFKDTLRGRDNDALFPLEQMGFIASVGPLAAAFADHGQALSFVELFDTLHRHWGSSRQTKEECDPSLPKTDARWCTQDAAVSYEPLLAEVLESDLFPAMHDFVQLLAATKIPHCDAFDPKTHACTASTDYDGVKILAQATRVLIDPSRNVGLVDRKGKKSVSRNDGAENPQVTPIYLLIDALKGVDRAFSDYASKSPAGEDRLSPWRKARSQIVDTFFSVDGSGKDSRFREPAIAQILPKVIDVTRTQIFAHCPDRSVPCTWARAELAKRLSDVVAGPTFAAVLDMLEALRKDPVARAEIERLVTHLIDDAAGSSAQTTTLAALVDLLQLLDDDVNLTPLYRLVATATEPSVVDEDGKVLQRGLVDAIVASLSRIFAQASDAKGAEICASEIDPNRTIDFVVKRLLSPEPGAPSGEAPIEVIMSVIADVNRADPSVTTKLDAADYANIAREIGDFCLDQARGLEQVYEVIREATRPSSP